METQGKLQATPGHPTMIFIMADGAGIPHYSDTFEIP